MALYRGNRKICPITNKNAKNQDRYISENGTYTAAEGYSGLGTVTVNVSTSVPIINPLDITPSTSTQNFSASGVIKGFSPVVVNAVTSDIDSNITAGNIKSGVTILGVEGTLEELKGEIRTVSITSTAGDTFTPSSDKNGITSITVSPNNQDKTVTATTSQQTLDVPSGYSGYGVITVNPVTSAIDPNIAAGNIKSGVTILGVPGTVEELNGEIKSVTITNEQFTEITPSEGKNAMTMVVVSPKNQSLEAFPSTATQTFNVPEGYSGYGTVHVGKVTSSIDSNIRIENIRKNVTILGVTGDLEELIGERINIFPSTTTQTITPSSGYTGITRATVNPVTSSIDNNIIAANIKKGVTILGVTGTYEGEDEMKIGVPVASLSSTIPSNCIALEGQEVSKTTYSQLFDIYGTTYGTPTDTSKFTLPDFRGRVPWGTEDGTFGTLAAGLPNHYHNLPYIGSQQADVWPTEEERGYVAASYERGSNTYEAMMDGTNIYGASSTVRPPSVKVRWYTRYQ